MPRHDPEALPTVEGLAGVRRFVGMTQQQVAERMGIVQSRVSDIERKWPHVRLSTAQAYVRALGGRLRVDMVFDAEEDAKKTGPTPDPQSQYADGTEAP